MESKYNLLTRLLNNIKNVVNPDGSVAGSGGVLVVHVVKEGTADRLDKTYKEIADAGFCVREVLVNDGLHVITPISSFAFVEGYGGAVMFGSDNYICSAENEYPALSK